MITIYDNDTGASLGTLTEQQLAALSSRLEEESADDHDYYINRATVDLLAAENADAGLISFLQAALGAREEMEIRWEQE